MPPLASVADVFWSAVALFGGVGGVGVMIWVARTGPREREAEDAARAFFDEHGHWPDEEPGAQR